MKWRTEVVVPEGGRRIRYSDAILSLGSCFADHLGAKLAYFKFPHVGNPFGVIFHPVALENLLSRAVEDRAFTSDDLVESQGRWRCLESHSVLSGDTPDKALKCLNEALEDLKKALAHSTHAVITLGTAYGFYHLQTGLLVANCHKLPSRDFERQLSPPETLSESLSRILTLLRYSNKDLTCVLTVSPVRHTRDGLVENQRSKAHLITAVHALVQEGLAEYFPSYELFMDELRDYRFYDRDLIHPSVAAIDYVWERFEQAWIDSGAGAVMAEVDSIQRGLAHRPVHKNSREQQKFKDTLERKIQNLKQRYPYMNFR